MATYSATRGGTLSAPSRNCGRLHQIENIIDFSEINSGSVAQNDIVTALNIPANTFVFGVFAKALTAGNAAADTLQIGDGASATLYGTLDATTAGTDVGTIASGGGKFYSTADTIDIKQANASAVTSGKVQLVAICFTPVLTLNDFGAGPQFP